MLFESAHLRLTAEYGIATLWLGFPGASPNELDLLRLRQLDAALEAVAATPAVQILVVRSAHPEGFCSGIRPEVLAGLTHPAERAAFAWFAQHVCQRLAHLQAVTLAYIAGPCLGAGLELALACDYRLCVAGPTTHLGFPDRIACCGGSTRLRKLLGRRASALLSSGGTLSGRESQALGLVDLACSERRAKIELRSTLDRLELRPAKPHAPLEQIGLAAERRAFAAWVPPAVAATPSTSPLNPIPPLPRTLGLLGDDANAAGLAAAFVLRGGRVVVAGKRSLIDDGIHDQMTRGFITPLEADQARTRVRSADNLEEFRTAGLVLVAAGSKPFRLATTVLPRVLVGVICPPHPGLPSSLPPDPIEEDGPASLGRLAAFPYPRRVVPIRFGGAGQITLVPTPTLDSDATTTLAAWLKSLGRNPIVVPTSHFLQRCQIPLLESAEESALPYHEKVRSRVPVASEV